MKAAICPRYGGPDVVEVLDVVAPEPGPAEVRVRVAAASVNFPDVLLIGDQYQLSVPPPFVPGSEFAGIVDAVGAGVGGSGPALGDHVTGTVLVGAFAEQVVVAASSVRPVPAGIDSHTAAAFGVAHRTAHHVLRSVARLEPGDELVVLGAGGGVGLAAVQLGVHLGARVTAVASSPAKLDVAAANGAHRLIDHRRGPLRDALRELVPAGVDVVVDPVGGPLSEPALRAMRWGGRFVTVGYASGSIPKIPLNLVLLKGVHLLGFQYRDFATNRPEECLRNDAELDALLGSGAIVPHVGATFTLDDVVAALQHVGDGRAIGKVILAVRPT